MNSDRICVNCGTSIAELLSRHRVGCKECYVVFRSEIAEILRREQGFSLRPTHSPLTVTDGESIRDHLETLLSEAISREEYEIAAKLRDQINALKRSPSNV